jgi:hypothetical protein
MATTQQTQQQGIEITSQALPSDGLSRFVRAGAWAAMVSGLALIVSMLLEWLVVPYERLGQTTDLVGICGGGPWFLRLEERSLNHLIVRT